MSVTNNAAMQHKPVITAKQYSAHRKSMRECGYDPYDTSEDLMDRIYDELWWQDICTDGEHDDCGHEILQAL